MLNIPSRTAAFVLLVALGAVPAQAVVWRADADQAQALVLGARFPAVGRVVAPQASATLIAPQWALTAAHVAADLAPGAELEFGGVRHAVAEVVIHPSGAAPAGARQPPEVDLALLRLAAPVTGIVPLAPYRGRAEQGARLVLVGFGDHGAAGAVRQRADGRRRAVENLVADAGPRRLFLPFDAPPAGPALEGIGAAGDSGGPALIEVAGAWQVAGVSSGADGPPGAYGTVDVYARVSAQAAWIDGVIAGGDAR